MLSFSITAKALCRGARSLRSCFSWLRSLRSFVMLPAAAVWHSSFFICQFCSFIFVRSSDSPWPGYLLACLPVLTSANRMPSLFNRNVCAFAVFKRWIRHIFHGNSSQKHIFQTECQSHAAKKRFFYRGLFFQPSALQTKALSNHDGRAEVTSSTATTSRTQQQAHYLCLSALCNVWQRRRKVRQHMASQLDCLGSCSSAFSDVELAFEKKKRRGLELSHQHPKICPESAVAQFQLF